MRLFPKCVVLAGMLMAIHAWSFGAEAAPGSRPNIIVILVDDMGFSDISCYGSEIQTPHLDKLAAEGLRFTQFYNTGRCCPTRTSLLTGLYAHEAGVGHMMENDGVPGYVGHLNDKCVTIGQVLQKAGYFTAMTGKWHVGQDQGVVPWNRGFDDSFNSPAGGFYYQGDARSELYLNGRKLDVNGPELPKGWYTTDLYTDYAIKFVDDGLSSKKPFFLYLAYNAPHFPLEAPADEIAKFRGKYQMGWDALRDQRHAEAIKAGVVEKTWALSPRPEEVKAWQSLDADQRDRFDHIMAIYAAVVQHMDTAVGRLVESLKQRGVLDNTLILFMSDNGGNAESGPKGVLEGNPPGGPGGKVFEGMSWATLSNTPFRRYKHFNHEGGIATPLIVHWPDRIKSPGGLRTEMGHVIDIMPTCVDVAGAAYPTEFDGKPILPMEGRSLIPALDDKPIEREALFWEHEGNAAIRSGDWKLVRAGRKGPWELYNMAIDRTELHDLSMQEPTRKKELEDQWEAWAKRTNVEPYPGKKGKNAPAN
jgi:arylsulfatase A-like enzyme